MLSRIDLRGRSLGTAELRRTLPRGAADVDSVVDTVRPVVEAIREHGAPAALEYGETFDSVRPASVRVPAEVIARAVDEQVPAGVFEERDGRLLVGAVEGALELRRVRPAGGKSMDAASFLRGYPTPRLK